MKGSLLLFSLLCVSFVHAQVTIRVDLATGFHGPYNGRLLVYTLRDTTKVFNDQTMQQEPAFRIEVRNWTGGQAQIVDRRSVPFMQPVDSLESGYYKLIAILDTNTIERGKGAEGNLYSRKEGILHVGPNGKGEGTITLNAMFKQREFRASSHVRELVLPSALLGKFRAAPVNMKAAVILPASYYADTSRRYPVVYIIPGWGGTHYHGAIEGNQRKYGIGQGKDKIYVYLNPESQTPYGLHAFVDSRVNGPWGAALVHELLPHVQRYYRGTSQSFITGQSSGGYGALWLALHYPQYFSGCWATSPDPVDFSSFTGVDLYRDQNFYVDSAGRERGIYLLNGEWQTTLRKSYAVELFEGDGGQQQSFEAEFGMPGKNGRPQHLFDPASGIINQSIVSQWRQYDLALYVQTQWPRLRKWLSGRIHIYCGQYDNFRLNESVRAFARKAASVKAAIHIEEIPGADHFTVRDSALTCRIQAEMDALCDL